MSIRLASYAMWRIGFSTVVLAVAVGCGSLCLRGHYLQSSGSISISTLDPLDRLKESGAGAALQDVVVAYVAGEIRGELCCGVFSTGNANACARGDLFTGRLQNGDVAIKSAGVSTDRGFAWIILAADDGDTECYFDLKRDSATDNRWTVSTLVMCFPEGADP